MKAPEWLVQDAPEDPILGGEYDPPSHDGGVLVSALVVGLLTVGVGAILVGLILF